MKGECEAEWQSSQNFCFRARSPSLIQATIVFLPLNCYKLLHWLTESHGIHKFSCVSTVLSSSARPAAAFVHIFVLWVSVIQKDAALLSALNLYPTADEEEEEGNPGENVRLTHSEGNGIWKWNTLQMFPATTGIRVFPWRFGLNAQCCFWRSSQTRCRLSKGAIGWL